MAKNWILYKRKFFIEFSQFLNLLIANAFTNLQLFKLFFLNFKTIFRLDHTVMKEDEIDGQEEITSGLEGEIRMTAFNMREEYEEGHFDVDGNFYWNKDKEIRDNWLDNIDWAKVPITTQGKLIKC